VSPKYLSELLSPNPPTRNIRSQDSFLLSVPCTRSHALYSSSFTVVAPRL
ncbi:hypothetical protein CAPTEDRAFT_108110, partial [Capitella teleta]